MFKIASIFRTVAIYLGLVQADTGDLCIACQYDLAPRGGAFCAGCEDAQMQDLGHTNCTQCNKQFPVTVDSDGFCSNKCFQLWIGTIQAKVCKLCGSTLYFPMDADEPCDITYADHQF